MNIKSVLTFGISATLLFACTHKFPNNPNIPNPNDPPTQSQICSVDTIYFQNEILPILNSNCAMSGCHDAGSHKEGVILDNYSNIIKTADVSNPNANKSDLYNAITETDPDKIMPPLGALPADAIAKIKKWIEQGARNNYCISCDSIGEMKYSIQIKNTIQSNCQGCHNTNNASGTVNLDNYFSVKANVDNGKLIGSITHASGYSAMPKNQSKMNDCKINQIIKWINNGAANN